MEKSLNFIYKNKRGPWC